MYPHYVGFGRCGGSFRSPLSFSVKSGAKSLSMSECGRGLLQVSGERTHEFGRRMGMDGSGDVIWLSGSCQVHPVGIVTMKSK